MAMPSPARGLQAASAVRGAHPSPAFLHHRRSTLRFTLVPGRACICAWMHMAWPGPTRPHAPMHA